MSRTLNRRSLLKFLGVGAGGGNAENTENTGDSWPLRRTFDDQRSF
jgi:hypothetical protein